MKDNTSVAGQHSGMQLLNALKNDDLLSGHMSRKPLEVEFTNIPLPVIEIKCFRLPRKLKRTYKSPKIRIHEKFRSAITLPVFIVATTLGDLHLFHHVANFSLKITAENTHDIEEQ
ncbi:hypothetical protein ABEB36_009113 [Hypothenemus hampei]|uniref:Uncharacterized protein n=1 Tax=Hypothenemus hampei TaxID=57062 RepID=A0ABD1EPQ4_HYPHA